MLAKSTKALMPKKHKRLLQRIETAEAKRKTATQRTAAVLGVAGFLEGSRRSESDPAPAKLLMPFSYVVGAG